MRGQIVSIRLLTIMASLAQQESQSMSQNIKLGLQYRYQQGKVQVNHNRFLGYTKDDNGHLIIDPEQAEKVKRIYREYLEGSSMDKSTVFADHFTVEFKSGITIEIEA